MRCYKARRREREQAHFYRVYMAAGMRLVVNAFAGVKLPDYDELTGQTKKDNRSGEQIATDVIKNAGLEVI